MKNKSITFILLLLSFLAVLGFTQINKGKFYYAYNEKIYLNTLENKPPAGAGLRPVPLINTLLII